MGKVKDHKALIVIIALAAVFWSYGCGDRDTGGNGQAEAEETSGGPLNAEIVVKDLITSSGANGEPPAYIIINRGDWVNFKGNVTGGTPPYTYNWDFDYVRPSLQVKDPGDIEFVNVNGTDYGVSYTVEFTAIDQAGSMSVDSIEVLVFND